MSGDDLTRREVLGGLAIAGSAGGLVGAGTSAALFDEESLGGNGLVGGVLDLAVAWETDGAVGSSEGAATVPIELTGDDRMGSARFTVSLPDSRDNNPAYGWLRATCPDPVRLATALEVTLRYDDCSDGGGVLASGSLHEVANALQNGVPLDPDCDPAVAPGSRGCLQPGEPLSLVLEWTLDEDYVGEESTAITFEFVGLQCRNRDGTTDPFPAVTACEPPPVELHGVSFVEIYTCGESGPEFVGKLELEDDYCGQAGVAENVVEAGRRYDLYTDAGECEADTGYDVFVTDTIEKVDDGEVETTGIAFELLEDDSDDGPDLCQVVVKGSGETVTYDDPSAFDGNATAGILTAPEKNGGGA